MSDDLGRVPSGSGSHPADRAAERPAPSGFDPSRSVERGTNEVAQLIGIAPDLLRKWKARGFLKLAPGGVSGQGRGNECFWSDEAIAEARRVAASRKPTKTRTRGAAS